MSPVTRSGTTRKGNAVFTRVQPTNTPALLIAASNPNRLSITIRNADAAVTCYLGSTSAVTALTGTPVEAGNSWPDDETTSAYYGITSAGTGDLRVVEVSG